MRNVRVGWELAAMLTGLLVLAATILLGLESIAGYSLMFLMYLVPVVVCSVVIRSVLSASDLVRR